jgi:3-hydroxyisobutyrate dehydrogenase-like beta-hydroxyacid dehydrogenase
VNITAQLALKDVSLVLSVVGLLHVPLPSVEVCRNRLLAAEARGDAQRDWSVIAL